VTRSNPSFSGFFSCPFLCTLDAPQPLSLFFFFYLFFSVVTSVRGAFSKTFLSVPGFLANGLLSTSFVWSEIDCSKLLAGFMEKFDLDSRSRWCIFLRFLFLSQLAWDKRGCIPAAFEEFGGLRALIKLWNPALQASAVFFFLRFFLFLSA